MKMNASQKIDAHLKRVNDLKQLIASHGIAVTGDSIWAVLLRQAGSEGQAVTLAAEYLIGRRPISELMIEVTR